MNKSQSRESLESVSYEYQSSERVSEHDAVYETSVFPACRGAARVRTCHTDHLVDDAVLGVFLQVSRVLQRRHFLSFFSERDIFLFFRVRVIFHTRETVLPTRPLIRVPSSVHQRT